MTRQSTTAQTGRIGNGTAIHLIDAQGARCNRWGSTNGTMKAPTLTPGEAVTCRRCLALEPAPVAAPARAPRTWDATAAETYVCAGDCGQEKPARSFPTTGKDGQRGVECRSCRDARKVAA
jgi:hypothetical protein